MPEVLLSLALICHNGGMDVAAQKQCVAKLLQCIKPNPDREPYYGTYVRCLKK